MRLTAAIVRSRGCHCPFKQIDRRPAGPLSNLHREKGEKWRHERHGRRDASADAMEKLSCQKFPRCLIMGPFPRIVNLFPRSANLSPRARTSKQSRTKREAPGQSSHSRGLQNIALCAAGKGESCRARGIANRSSAVRSLLIVLFINIVSNQFSSKVSINKCYNSSIWLCNNYFTRD